MATNNARGRPTRTQDTHRLENADVYELENSHVTIEEGGAGPIARIERTFPAYEREYAGPLPDATVEALREVAANV